MTGRQQWGIVAGIVAMLALALVAATHFLGDELFPIEVGTTMPAFTATTLDPAPVTRTLADYKGQVVLVNIWATWCDPCRVEMPGIEKLYEELGPRGLKVVAISIDDAGSERAIRDFVKEYKLTFDVLHADHEEIQKIYQTTGYPETFVIGREGTIRRKIIGAIDWSSEENRALIGGLLATSTAAR